MICVDASVVVRLVVEGTPGTVWYETWARWLAAGERFVAPSLLPCELTNALHRYVVAGHLTVAEADAALDADLAVLAARLRIEHRLGLPDAIQLATALSECCDALVTHDRVFPAGSGAGGANPSRRRGVIGGVALRTGTRPTRRRHCRAGRG